VLPFTSLGSSPEDASFSAGLHSDVLTRLAKLSSLKVIARTSVLEYATTQKPLRQIGQELGVGAILSGEVQRAGNALRLNLTLHDATSEDSLWAESYNREVSSKDIFAVQSEIAEAVARALQAQLSPADKKELRGVPTTNDKAYDAYLTGLALYGKQTQIEIKRSIASQETAVTLDPNFALAWASLANSRGTSYWLFEPSNSALLASAFDAARRALQIDPDLPEGHLRLGQCHYVSRDYGSALREYEIAAPGLPNSVELTRAMGVLHRRTGKWDQANEEFARGVELSPRDKELQSEAAITLSFTGQYDEALRHFELETALGDGRLATYYWFCIANRDGRVSPQAFESSSMLPRPEDTEEVIQFWRLRLLAHDLSGARAGLASIPELLSSQWYDYPSALLHAITDELAGDPSSAQREYEAARAASLLEIQARPADARPYAPLGLALAGLGQRDEALREARRATELLPIERDSIVGASLLLDRFYTELRVGALDEAVRTLDAYLSHPALLSLRALVLDPRLDALKGNAAFEELRTRRGVR
jgi:TolB-like protein/Flp pilus assembly protein TadD